MPEVLPDAAGRPARRPPCPAITPGAHHATKGSATRADPPTVAEVVAVMREAGGGVHGARLRALIIVLWRAGLRIHEALALGEADLDSRRGSLLVRRGKGGRRREVGVEPGSSFSLGSSRAWTYRSVRSCASPPGRRADAHGPQAPRAASSATPPHGPVYAAASHHISFDTRTPSRWPATACR
jgi:integrase